MSQKYPLPDEYDDRRFSRICVRVSINGCPAKTLHSDCHTQGCGNKVTYMSNNWLNDVRMDGSERHVLDLAPAPAPALIVIAAAKDLSVVCVIGRENLTGLMLSTTPTIDLFHPCCLD